MELRERRFHGALLETRFEKEGFAVVIHVILTCHNRKEKTINCIKTLQQGNPAQDLRFIVVDDASTDGTPEALLALKNQGVYIDLLHGDGNLYWAGGMRKGINHVKNIIAREDADLVYEENVDGKVVHKQNYAIILVNDDVDFYPGILDDVLSRPQDRLYIGATVDEQGNFSYGGIRYHRNLLGQKDIHYDMIPPEAEDRICDTCNANFLWIPGDIFMALPNIDPAYKHSLGDFDYGLTAGRAGYKLEVLDKYVGVCPDNPLQVSWRNPELSRLERIQKKESIKGAPAGPWFHFLQKNFGVGKALVYSATPYVRIMLGK